jgi:limonene-1,2-epoxide hydrolase
MSIAIEIVERFAKALDAEDHQAARALLNEECRYSCRGQQHIGPSAIIASYQGNGDTAKRKFDNVRYESALKGMPDGTVLVQFTDHLSLKGSHFVFECQQVVEVGDDQLISRIEHRDIPGQRDALAAFMQLDASADN